LFGAVLGFEEDEEALRVEEEGSAEVEDWVFEGLGVLADGSSVYEEQKVSSEEADNRKSRTHLHLEAPTPSLLLQRLPQLLTHQLNNLIFILEPNFLLRRMNVNIDFRRIDVEGEIDEGVGSFGEDGGVEGFEGALERGAVNVTICGRGKLSKRGKYKRKEDKRPHY
jgi:hypothetical protein